jgi:hypoxanthine phosphoribosyltransferase
MGTHKSSRPAVRFAHESEATLAGLFDFYGIAWEYEPVEFVLAWDETGRPTSAFRPDFYLPEHDLFVELTTLRQALVTRKHAKIRRLAELYPEVNVRILHRRDYANLLLKDRLGAPSSPGELVPASTARSA